MILVGQIVKGIGGFYYVAVKDIVYTLKAPGRFRKEGIKPVVGDMVEFDENGGYINKILPRKNLFYRPAVANVTQGVIVITGAYPKVDFMLLDKLLIQCSLLGIDAVIIVNKQDISDNKVLESIKEQYKAYPVICCSAEDKSGLDEVNAMLKGNTSFFAGQSGVGKSSLINALSEGINHETGEISDKLKRGRHTTRHVELIYLPELEGSILDTPGFSFYDFKDDFNISDCYKEFELYKDMCRFNMCAHIEEPDCAVREHVGKEINKDRYERYVILQKAREELRSKRYD